MSAQRRTVVRLPGGASNAASAARTSSLTRLTVRAVAAVRGAVHARQVTDRGQQVLRRSAYRKGRLESCVLRLDRCRSQGGHVPTARDAASRAAPFTHVPHMRTPLALELQDRSDARELNPLLDAQRATFFEKAELFRPRRRVSACRHGNVGSEVERPETGGPATDGLATAGPVTKQTAIDDARFAPTETARQGYEGRLAEVGPGARSARPLSPRP